MINIIVLRQLYEKREVNKIKYICDKNNPSDAMIKT